MNCSACGRNVPDVSRYCMFCGKAISSSKEVALPRNIRPAASIRQVVLQPKGNIEARSTFAVRDSFNSDSYSIDSCEGRRQIATYCKLKEIDAFSLTWQQLEEIVSSEKFRVRRVRATEIGRTCVVWARLADGSEQDTAPDGTWIVALTTTYKPIPLHAGESIEKQLVMWSPLFVSRSLVSPNQYIQTEDGCLYFCYQHSEPIYVLDRETSVAHVWFYSQEDRFLYRYEGASWGY